MRCRPPSSGFAPSAPWCRDPVWHCRLAPNSTNVQQINKLLPETRNKNKIWINELNSLFSTSLNSASFMALRSKPDCLLSYRSTWFSSWAAVFTSLPKKCGFLLVAPWSIRTMDLDCSLFIRELLRRRSSFWKNEQDDKNKLRRNSLGITDRKINNEFSA